MYPHFHDLHPRLEHGPRVDLHPPAGSFAASLRGTNGIDSIVSRKIDAMLGTLLDDSHGPTRPSSPQSRGFLSSEQEFLSASVPLW